MRLELCGAASMNSNMYLVAKNRNNAVTKKSKYWNTTPMKWSTRDVTATMCFQTYLVLMLCWGSCNCAYCSYKHDIQAQITTKSGIVRTHSCKSMDLMCVYSRQPRKTRLLSPPRVTISSGTQAQFSNQTLKTSAQQWRQISIQNRHSKKKIPYLKTHQVECATQVPRIWNCSTLHRQMEK